MSDKVCKVINKSFSSPQKTFIVLGVSRSGTSMVAGILREIGIFMGDVVANNHEDPLFLSDDVEQLKRLILDRNECHDIWGWKAPKSIFHMNALLPFIRNPHFLILSRDPFDIATSMKNREDLPFDLAIQHIFAIYKSLQNFVDTCVDPLALVSYNRAVANKDAFVSELIDFLDCPSLGQDSLIKARGFVGNSYRSTSSESKSLGDLSTATANPKAVSIIRQIDGSSQRMLKRSHNALGGINQVRTNLLNHQKKFPNASNSIDLAVVNATVISLKERLEECDGKANASEISPTIVEAEAFRDTVAELLKDFVKEHRKLINARYIMQNKPQ